MRIIILVSNTVDITKTLSLNSLTAYGRLDVICRCIATTFYLSDNFRKDVIMKIFFTKNNKLMVIKGDKIKGLNPDERAVAGVLRKVFSGKKFPGIDLIDKNPEEIIKEENCIVLDRQGQKFDEIEEKINKDTVSFLIGDQTGFSEEIQDMIKEKTKMTLGEIEYLSSQTITIIHYLLDQYNKK